MGGSQRQLLYLVENMDRSRYEPVVVCKDDGPFVDRLRQSCGHAHVMPLRPWRKLAYLLGRVLDARGLTELARAERVDLLHCSDLWMSGYLLLMARRMGLPSLLHVRVARPPAVLRKHQVHKADGLIAISNRIKRQLLEAGVAESRISVIYDGVDLADFRADRVATNVLRRDFPQARGTFVGIVGRIGKSKRQLEFLQTARRLVCDEKKDATFFVVGDPHEPRHYQRVRAYVAESGLADRVVFTGHRSDIADVLASLDVLITLSGGSVMIEAMACGTPVISAGYTPPEESTIVRHEETGLLVKESELGSATARLIDDLPLRERLARAARAHAEANYSHLALAEKTQQVYDRLIDAGGGRRPA